MNIKENIMNQETKHQPLIVFELVFNILPEHLTWKSLIWISPDGLTVKIKWALPKPIMGHMWPLVHSEWSTKIFIFYRKDLFFGQEKKKFPLSKANAYMYSLLT